MKTREELNQEYTGLCVQAGDLTYKILSFQEELTAVQIKQRNVNVEARKLKDETPALATAATEVPNEQTISN